MSCEEFVIKLVKFLASYVRMYVSAQIITTVAHS